MSEPTLCFINKARDQSRACTRIDYVDRMYDARRRNFWNYACPWQFATGNATFGGCSLQAQPNARTKPLLRYTQPNSYSEYMCQVHNINNTEEQVKASDHFEDKRGCVGCSIVPVNEDNTFDEGCGPKPVFKRRMRDNGQTFKPPSSLPVLDRYQWAQPESLYYFDSPKEYAKAYDAIYNGNLTPEARFHFQNPAEQTRLWAGIPPTAPPVPFRSIEPPYSTCGNVPIPYYRNYLESKGACGCNREQCAASVAASNK